MNIYTVYKQGVYRHEILGVFDTLENARKRAFLAALGEKDGYHNFAVAQSQLNEHVDDLKDLYYISSDNHVYGDYPERSNRRSLKSRDIVLRNTEYENIEVLITMTEDLELQ